MNFFLDGIFNQNCDSPNKVTLEFTEWDGFTTQGRTLYGLLGSEPTLSSRNKWGPVLDNVSMLADFSSMMGSQSMFSWIGASVMCWKGTDPLRLSLDFYLINYKKGLQLEEKLEALTKLTALAEIKANNNDIMGKISVAVHGGYSADALSDNQSMFNNKGYVRSQRLANPNNNQIIGFMNGLLDGADKLGNESGLVRIPQEGAPKGVITVQIGKKVAITNMLASGIDVTPSMAEVAEGKALFYRVNLSLTGARPLLTTDVNGMYSKG